MNVRIFGPPGTGKTYTLVKVLGHMIGIDHAGEFIEEYGVELPFNAFDRKDIVFMSHTNTAVDELIGRLGLRRTYKSGLWGTMHGIALHLLLEKNKSAKKYSNNTLSKPGAVNWWKSKFAREYGIAYDPDEEAAVLPGNRFFQAYSKAVHVYFPEYNDMKRVLDKLSQEDDEFGRWAEGWIKFKKEHKIIDFDDMLVLAYMADVVPDHKVLIADEFQDFSPLQWALFKNWMVDMEYTIVAGDDDQCLYSYTGASPKFMLHEFPADESIVLKRSFRLPSQILALSKMFVSNLVTNRYPKEFSPRTEGGKVTMKSILPYKIPSLAQWLAKNNYNVLVLARTNSQVRMLEELFLHRHVPYYRLKTRKAQVWKDFVDRIVSFVEALRAGERVPVAEARFYLKFTGLPKDKIEPLAKAIADNPRNLAALKITQKPAAHLKLSKLVGFFGSQKRAHLAMGALKMSLTGATKLPAKIYLDTIHAAKGREADAVILYDSLTNRVMDEMYAEGRESFETEARVWYVGMTRARSILVINRGEYPFVTPQVNRIVRTMKAKVAERRE